MSFCARRSASQRTRSVEKIFSRNLVARAGEVIVRSEQNESAAAVGKLDACDNDHQLRRVFCLSEVPLSGKAKRIHAGESFLGNSTPPKSFAVQGFSNVYRFSYLNPSVFRQHWNERLKRPFRLLRQTPNMDVKLVLAPRKARIYGERDIVMSERLSVGVRQKRAGVPSVLEIVWGLGSPKRRILNSDGFLVGAKMKSRSPNGDRRIT